MKNIKLILQYDGTNYHGFQIQPIAVTVQGTLQKVISEIFNENVKVYGCSRTDAGVHARRYCASFVLNKNVPAEKIAFILNNRLPGDIRILSSCEVPPDFHARFSIKSKKYMYNINTSTMPDVFSRNYEWQLGKNLDTELMKEAAQYMIGTHDFCSFMTRGPEMETTVRTIFSMHVAKSKSNVKIYIRADGYLYNMVRIITGTLVMVGLKKIKPGEIKNIIEKKDRDYAGPTAPPQGLELYEVYY